MTLKDGPSGAPIRTDSPSRIAAVTCFTAIFSYLTARLAGFLVIPPEMIWPLWPGCAFVLAMLLLTPPEDLASDSTSWPCRIRGLRYAGKTSHSRHRSSPWRRLYRDTR